MFIHINPWVISKAGSGSVSSVSEITGAYLLSLSEMVVVVVVIYKPVIKCAEDM